MFCEKCGTQLQDTDKFCYKCGAHLSASGDAGPVEGTRADSLNAMPRSEQSEFNIQSIADMTGETFTGAEGAKKGTVSGLKGVQRLLEKGKELTQSAGEGKISKKKRIFLFAGVAAAVFLIVIIANAANLENFFYKTFSSPEKYYQYVETKNAEEWSSIAGELYKRYLLERKDDLNSTYNATVAVEFGKTGQDFLELAGLAGVDLSWIKSASFSGGVALNENRISLNLASVMNKSSFMSFITTVDMDEGEAFLQIPELTNTYIGIDLEETMGYSYDDIVDSWEELKEMFAESFEDLPSRAKLEKLLDKYIKIALSCVEDVDKNTKTLKIEGVEQKCTVFEVVIDARTVADMLDAILDEAEDDQTLEDFVVELTEAMGENGDDFYEDLIDELGDIQRSLKSVRGSREIVMTVYVDSKGDVKGREIKVNDVTISMLMPQKGNKFGYEFSVTEGRNSVSLTGSGKRSGDKIDGDFNLRYTGTAILEITTDDLDLAALKKGRLNGKMEVNVGSGIGRVAGSVPGLSVIQDMGFSLEAKTSDGSGEYNFGLIYDDEDVGSISISAERKHSSSIKIPNDRNVIFVEDYRDLEDWVEEIDWDRFVSNLEKTDMPRSVIRTVEELGEVVEDGDMMDFINSFIYRGLYTFPFF